MHLAILSSYGSVTFYYNSSIVVESRRTTLEQRSNNNHSTFLSHLTKELGRRSGYWFSQIKVVYILYLAEVKRVVKFLQNHKFGTTHSQVAYTFGKSQYIGLTVSDIVLLKISYFQMLHNLLSLLILLILCMYTAKADSMDDIIALAVARMQQQPQPQR